MMNTRAFYQLALANWRELIRDFKMIILVFVPPLLLMLMFPLIAAMTKEESLITLVVPADAAQTIHDMAGALQSSRDLHFEVVDDSEGQRRKEGGEFEALVFLPASADAGSVVIETPADSTVSVYVIKPALERAAREVGIPALTIRDSGGFYADPLRYGTVGSLVYALASLGVFGVAGPIIAMRQQGILRLMRTTPVTRLTFVLAQVPARLILGMGITLCALLASWAVWDVTLPQLAAAFGTSMLGFWMLAAFGYLVGGTLSSAEASFAVGSPALTLGAIGGAVLFPLVDMPGWVQALPPFIPLTYLADALRQNLGVGGTALFPLWLDLVILVAITLAVTFLAVRLFRWDLAEQKYSGERAASGA